jgi:hypothetical protein
LWGVISDERTAISHVYTFTAFTILHVSIKPTTSFLLVLRSGMMELHMSFPKALTGLVPIGYRGALLSSLLHVTVYVTHNLMNVLVQIANKIGFKKKT